MYSISNEGEFSVEELHVFQWGSWQLSVTIPFPSLWKYTVSSITQGHMLWPQTGLMSPDVFASDYY